MYSFCGAMKMTDMYISHIHISRMLLKTRMMTAILISNWPPLKLILTLKLELLQHLLYGVIRQWVGGDRCNIT